MNAELIDLYQGVQKYRGEWKVGDRVIHDLYGPGIVAGVDDSLRLNVTFTDCKIEPLRRHEADLLWLPPVWSDDGRCLIGMLGWCDISKYKELNGKPGYAVWHGGRYFHAPTLPEALLRAIALRGDKS